MNDQKDTNIIENAGQRCNDFLNRIHYNQAEFEIINVLAEYLITPVQAKQMFAELESYFENVNTITCTNEDCSILSCYNDDGSLLMF